MASTVGWFRRQASGVVALVLLLSVFQLSQLPSAAAEEVDRLAGRFGFTPLAIALPGGLPTQTLRAVNQDYHHIRSWISSVGAGIAMADLDGDGLANDLCLTDPRSDRVIVTPAPVPGPVRYEPFALDPAPLPFDRTMAPMGCSPGDFNVDGRMDLLVYCWGRTPIIFLARADATALAASAYAPVEMLAGVSRDGRYLGPQWNTNAVAVADFDGDGYEDVFVGNYFPDGPVLDDTVAGGVTMNESMSYALNAGENQVYRWTGASGGARPSVSYRRVDGVLPPDVAAGWTLAAAATDLDGDQLPELYVANDFGPDRLLHNRSRPGEIALAVVTGERDPLVPKSKVLGRSSFKGMGVDVGDLDGDGLYDLFVSNITTSYGLQESNFAFISTARDRADLRAHLSRGGAPYADRSAPLGLAWTGWGWDAKLADLDNDGGLEVIQATGFLKGKTNLWPQLQELAASNDDLLADPQVWPRIEPGADIAGDQSLAFLTEGEDGRYVNLSEPLGLAVPVPTRGVAVGDADGDGWLDFAVARQWDEPIFYRNEAVSDGASLALRLVHDPGAGPAPAGPAPDGPGPDGPAAGTDGAAVLPAGGSPVVGAQVTVTTPDGRTLLGRVDGGSGHSGRRSHEAFIGLGAVDGPVTVRLAWRDRDGVAREDTLRLRPGRHTIRLGTYALEVTS
jgi:hypothetical protein